MYIWFVKCSVFFIRDEIVGSNVNISNNGVK